MRVLMTTDTVGGVWQYALALVRGLVEHHSCRVALVCFGEPPEADLDESLPDEVEIIPLRRKLEWMPDSAGDVRASLEEVDRLASLWHPDLVHSNQYCFGLLETPAPRVVVAHSDLLGWLIWHRGPAAAGDLNGELWEYRHLVSAGLAGATEVVCPSRFMADSLEALYRRTSRVIYNGLWPDGYPSRSAGTSRTSFSGSASIPLASTPEGAGASPPSTLEGTSATSAHLSGSAGVPPASEPTRAILAGRLWDEAKRAEVAVGALDGLPVELRLVGPTVGPQGESCYLPAAPNAHYLGPKPWRESRELIADARLYLATSSYEPFGLAALEAALCGCALLANDLPSYRELWEGAALFYRRDDATDLRRIVAVLLESPLEMDRLGLAARQRALERYTSERMAAEYLSLYQVIGDRG